jgi:Questin oxidase-like
MKQTSRRTFVRKTIAALPALPAFYFLFEMPWEKQLHAEATNMEDIMDEALEMLAQTGPEYQGGLANHGPMAAEALIAMDRPDSVVNWVERYKKGLQSHPTARGEIPKTEWRQSLGNFNLSAEWIAFFDRELKEKPWRSVLNDWVTNLAPGLSAAAGHGLLRTAHITRRLAKKENERRLHELAEGLGYWAARYQILPSSQMNGPQKLQPSQAINQIKLLPDTQRLSGGSITRGLLRLDDFPPFADAINLVDTSGDPEKFISNLTETFATVYVENPSRRYIISFIHAVTAPSAIRLLLPYLSADAKRSALRYGWQLAAGIYSVFGETLIKTKADDDDESKQDLIDRAVKNGDEHAIKFTEACLREYALNPKPVYLLAARMVSDELN